jgi:hypothetical protein
MPNPQNNADLVGRPGVIHQTLYPNGRTKPPGLFAIQQALNITDDEPLAAILATILEGQDMALGLPQELTDERVMWKREVVKLLSGDREQLSKIGNSIAANADKIQTSASLTAATMEAIQADIAAIALKVLAEFDSEKAGAVLGAIVEKACASLPLKQIAEARAQLEGVQTSLAGATQLLRNASNDISNCLPKHQQLADHFRAMRVGGYRRAVCLASVIGTLLGAVGITIFFAVQHTKF